MKLLFQEIRRNPVLWLLVFVPVALALEKLNHEAHTLHFVLSVLAILPLAVLLSHATESVAAKTGDSVGGFLNATLGNLTELVIAIAALQAGQYTLVKASVAGAIVTNSLFMLGASFLLGGLKYHLQEYNPLAARFQAGLLFLATVARPVRRSAGRIGRTAPQSGLKRCAFHFAAPVIWAWALVLPQDSSRIIRRLRRRTRSGVAYRSGDRYAGGCNSFRRSGQRSVCGIGSVRRHCLRNESCLCWIHCGSSGRCVCRNGGSVFGRAQKSPRSEREHRARKRRPDRALRGSGAGLA